MENDNPILDELKELSPVLAAAGRQMLYAVPEAYFDNLPLQLMLRIALEEKAGADPHLNIGKDNVYTVPQEYFDNLAGNIINRVRMGEPANTKEELEKLSPLLSRLDKKAPFSFPEGYFNDLPENLIAGVNALDFVNEELENLSPVMRSLKDKQVYEVPRGYFETTGAVILQKAKEQPSKLVSMPVGKRIMRYAVAAMITGIVAVSGYMIMHKPSGALMADSNSKPPVDSVLAKASDQDLESFLNNNTIALADIGADTDSSSNPTAVGDMSDLDAKDLLANITDDELQRYVDQHSETPIAN